MEVTICYIQFPVVISAKILFLRGQRVMLDRDLAALYQVPTGALNQAVKRHHNRFPEDFMFQLSEDEFRNWISQSVISNPAARMGIRRRPYAFTEQGVAMLSSVLTSERAVEVNIEIMRSFVRLRALVASDSRLEMRLHALKKRYDGRFQMIFEAIRQLMGPAQTRTKKIGFKPE